MDVIEDTLTLNPYVTCFQDILLHGQDIRSIKRAIGEFSSDYHIFSDIGAHAIDVKVLGRIILIKLRVHGR